MKITNEEKNQITSKLSYGVAGLILALTSIQCSIATTGALKKPGAERNVLLVMDVQNDFTRSEGAMPVAAEQSGSMLKNINKAVAKVKDRPDWEVIYIGNEFSRYSFANLFRNFAAIQGTDGAALDKRLAQGAGPYFAKDYPDAFANGKLDAFLRKRNIGRVYLAGVFADQCVHYTAQGAANRGYEVYILQDAVATGSSEDLAEAIADYQEAGFKTVNAVGLE